MTFLDRHLERGELPLWFQIKEQLRRAIQGGSLAPGDQVPTEQELTEFFGVSRTTVRSALEALVHHGLVERTPGRGTFVTSAAVEQPVNRLAGFHEDMRERGLVPSARTDRVEFSEAPAEVLSRLGVDRGPVVLIERLLIADDEPMAYQRSYLPEWVLGGQGLFSVQDLDMKSLYDLLEDRTASRPEWAEETIEATAAEGKTTELLGVREGSPLLRARRLCFDRSRRPVEFVDVWYRADRYRYSVELSRS
ncbi:MAG: GntR family transcriptional regulator [Acidimicrobiia bacterium]